MSTPATGSRSHHALPTTRSGWWSVGLCAVMLVSGVLSWWLVEVAAQAGDFLPVVMAGLTSTVALVGTVVCGLYAVARLHDRSTLVVLALAGALLTLVVPPLLV